AHHLSAGLHVHAAEHGDRLTHHQRALVHGDAAADRHRVALDDAAGLELDGAAHADHVALDDLPLLHGEVALEDANHVAAAAPGGRAVEHLDAAAPRRGRLLDQHPGSGLGVRG